jgi:integrase
VLLEWWSAYVFVFWRDADGKNRRTSIARHDKGTTASEARGRARAKLAEIAKEIKVGINRPTERQAMTIDDLIDRYLEHAADHVAPSTLVQVKGMVRRCFTQDLRAQRLSAFTREQIEELHRMIGRTRGKLAANNWYRLTRGMFNLAVDWGMHNVSPCRRIELFKENQRTRHLSQAEAERLNNALLQDPDWRWRALFPLLLFTGLRKGELLALTWNRVDFDQRTVTIEKRKNKEPLLHRSWMARCRFSRACLVAVSANLSSQGIGLGSLYPRRGMPGSEFASGPDCPICASTISDIVLLVL